MDWFAGLSILNIVLLCFCSFLGSVMTAALGVGGGAFLITVMADIVPPFALIPVHGIVQLASNGSRALLTRQHVQFRLVGFFLAGGLLASLLSVYLLKELEPDWIPVLVAVFILWLCWGPIPELGVSRTPAGLAVGGLLTTLATMLFGATGPLVSAWLGRTNDNRWVYTANFSTCMTFQHALKIVVFGFAGFYFVPWLPVVTMMIFAGYLGTKAGLKILGKWPDKQFKSLFKWVLSLLAIRLIWQWWVI